LSSINYTYSLVDYQAAGTISQDGYEVDKLATGLTYQQLNGGGVTTSNLANQIKIVFRL
jgi:hypothetical protein